MHHHLPYKAKYDISYGDAVKEFILAEKNFAESMDATLKVFLETFEQRADLFTEKVSVEAESLIFRSVYSRIKQIH